jgi:branched-chain amino acid transport system permease protein
VSKRNSSIHIVGLVVLLAIMCILPFSVKEYYVEILILFLINVILATSYRLVTTTGDWSLSHVVLMGSGAYASALMAKYFGWPFWLTAPLAAITAGLVGLAFIYPLLRTKGFGFFIASFAIGEFLRLIWIKIHNPFGGPRGMIDIPYVGALGAIDFFDAIPYYFLALGITAVSVWIMYRIDGSRIGDTYKAIHTDDLLSECVGIRVPRYRTQAFVVGASFAGLGGALLAHRLTAIDPHNFDITTMVYLIIWVVVGGTATFAGPIIGVAVITLVFEWARPLLEWRPFLFGAILVVFLIFLPGGIESLLPEFLSFFRRVAGLVRRA